MMPTRERARSLRKQDPHREKQPLRQRKRMMKESVRECVMKINLVCWTVLRDVAALLQQKQQLHQPQRKEVEQQHLNHLNRRQGTFSQQKREPTKVKY